MASIDDGKNLNEHPPGRGSAYGNSAWGQGNDLGFVENAEKAGAEL